MASPAISLLGTGTCQLVPNQATTSALIELPKLRVLFDLGRGVCQRLTQRGLRSDDLQHIVFSHYHPDHISDLIPYLQDACWSQIAKRTRDLHLYGPKGLKEQVMSIIRCFGPQALVPKLFKLHFHECKPGKLKIGEYEFLQADLPPADNLGLKFQYKQRWYALTGDSYYHPQLIKFARGCDVIVIDSGHSTDDQIIEMAVASQPKHIICSHLYRKLNAKRLTAQARAKGFRGKFSIGQDLQRILLSA